MNETNIETIELTPDDQRVALAENRPFHITGSADNRVGILLVHGFTGSPWEMRQIALNFSDSADRILGIRLPGHGTTPADLAERTCEEWQQAVELGYKNLSEDCDEIIGVGLSTGSLLLLATAEKLSFQGLILLSPYLRMRQWLARFAGILSRFFKYNRRPVESDLSPYYYQDRPLAAVHQINRLIRNVSRKLNTVRIPVLVASAAGDVTVNSESAIDLYNQLGSLKKEYYRFGKEVPHVLTTADNPKLDEVLKITARFASTLTGDRSGPALNATA